LKIFSKFELPKKDFLGSKENSKNSDLILSRIARGEIVAYVSDAGTPVVSDPGRNVLKIPISKLSQIVDQCHEENLPVFCIPGASSVTGGLSVSGFHGNRFVFEGFLPKKKSERVEVLQNLKKDISIQDKTIIFFESPDRIISCLEDCIEVFGAKKKACLCRELTKAFEQVFKSNLVEILKNVKENGAKGEYTMIISSEK
jgi:16S rRNA (cytidine1402-2'-O)-methyltransferase